MELDSIVKQLSTSRTKDLKMNPKDQNFVNDDSVSVSQNLSKKGKVVDAQPQQYKKQVRRRLHTTKPYQERLLNMAEARREIVTALKFHRASMKEASEQQQQQQQQQQEFQEQLQRQRQSLSPQPTQHQSFEQDGRYNKSRRNHRIYPSCITNSSSYLNDFSYPSVQNSYTLPVASASPSPIVPPTTLFDENLNLILPNQPLGLNLNFHDFNNLEFSVHINNPSSSSSYSSGTSSSASQDVPSVGTSSQVEGFSIDSHAAAHVNGSLHTVMDDEAMAEIKSLGDQYQMEWNDTMNLVKSACWVKYLKNIEHGVPETKAENDAYRDFDQSLEFPAWLNANESCLELCSEDNFQASTLPCMDIGDIDGMDDDWLA